MKIYYFQQALILAFCSLFLTAKSVHAQCNTNDSLALVALYDATNGANWTNKTNWKVVGKAIGTWYGVQVDNNGCVVCIDLDGSPDCLAFYFPFTGNNLVGTLPTALNNLTNLKHLFLGNNKISGTIPNFTLSNLQDLDLGRNQLTGTIPNFNLPNLQNLSLSINQLTGTIPNFNLPNFIYLSLYNNQLSGAIPNFNLPNLQYLDIYNNQLTGTIPNFNIYGLGITN